MSYLKKNDLDDSLVRNKVIEIYKDLFNISLYETPQELKIIDLKSTENNNFGVECEHGKWEGCFWKNKTYNSLSGFSFPTINIPIRKEKHWEPKYTFYGKEIDNSESYLLNQFVRTNKDFSQFILIESQIIRDKDKKLYSQFKPNNSRYVESWMSFRREHVKTYNLIKGKYILDTSHGNK